jgi:hypothetical protein
LIVLLASAGRRAGNEGVPAVPGASQSPDVVLADRGVVLEDAVLATIRGCMIGAKVLSPQFVLWIAPLLALAVRDPLGAALALLTAGLTSEVFPGRYFALMDQAPGHGRAVIALAARNALLIGWYAAVILRLAKQRLPAHRLDGGASTLPGPLLPLRRSRAVRPAR